MYKIKKLIEKYTNEIIIERNKKNTKTNGSMGELLWDGFSQQSTNIKFGHVIEKSFNDIIPEDYRLPLTHIYLTGKTTQTQLDIIFRKENTVYYFESKNNINLDTEKMPACLDKISRVKDCLEELYPQCFVVAKIFTARFSNVQDISKKFFKNGLTSDKVIGYNDFFDIVGETHVNEEDWHKIIRGVSEHIATA